VAVWCQAEWKEAWGSGGSARVLPPCQWQWHYWHPLAIWHTTMAARAFTATTNPLASPSRLGLGGSSISRQLHPLVQEPTTGWRGWWKEGQRGICCLPGILAWPFKCSDAATSAAVNSAARLWGRRNAVPMLEKLQRSFPTLLGPYRDRHALPFSECQCCVLAGWCRVVLCAGWCCVLASRARDGAVRCQWWSSHWQLEASG
jgi:hypothetical protein